MTTPANGRPPAKNRTIRNLVIIGLIILVGLAVEQVFRAIQAPWSFGRAGTTPEGDWIAPVTLEDGTTGALFMTLDLVFDSEDVMEADNIEGTARYCLGDHTGTFGVSGRLDRSGAVEDFGFSLREEDPVWILYPDGGQWDESGPSLSMFGRYSYDPTRQHISSTADPEPTFEFVFEPATGEMMSVACP